MHAPPSTEVVQRLVGAALELVGFGKFTVHLSFENGNRISFGAPFRFARANELSKASVIEFPLTDSNLVRALGSTVSDTACDDDGTLTLTFANADTLVIYANDPMYEAYTLFVDGRKYVV